MILKPRGTAVFKMSLLPEHTIEISKHDIASVFKNLKKKTAGHDRITGELLKECREQLSSVFQVLFQLCVELTELPLQ